MKNHYKQIINAIECEIEYQTNDGDHWQNLIDCLLKDDIAYNEERYKEIIGEALERLNIEHDADLLEYILDWLADNGDCLEGAMVRNYWAPQNTLLYCAIDEIEVDFASYDIKPPSKLLQNYISSKTDYYCSDDVICAHYCGDGISFTLPDDILLEVVDEYNEYTRGQ